MPYATNGQISQASIEGGIEITAQQYAEALAGMMGGKLITIDGGFAVIDPPKPEEPEPLPEPEPGPPTSVTPAQGLMALYALKGITEDDILAAIGTIEDATLRYQAQIAYKKATSWERESVTMQTLAGLLALTEPDLDELFTKAATYTSL